MKLTVHVELVREDDHSILTDCKDFPEDGNRINADAMKWAADFTEVAENLSRLTKNVYLVKVEYAIGR